MTPEQTYYTLPGKEWATDLSLLETRSDVPPGYRLGHTLCSPAYNAIAVIRLSDSAVLRVRLVPDGMQTDDQYFWREIARRMNEKAE